MRKAWSEHIVKSCNNGHIDLSDDGLSATFIHPGLHYRHFDRDGKPHIGDVMNFVNEIRNVSLLSHSGPKEDNHLDFLRLIHDRLIFVLSTHLEMTREFYDKNIPKWPVRTTNSLCYLGNSSLGISVKVCRPELQHDNAAPLVTLRSTYALVDRVTRRAKPFPDWYRAKYGDRLGQGATPCRVETLMKPRDTFHSQTKVMWTDTDNNDHTNFAAYANYTINALRSALRQRTAHARQTHHQLQQQQLQDKQENKKKHNDANTAVPAPPTHTTDDSGCHGDAVSCGLESGTDISQDPNPNHSPNPAPGLQGISQDIVQSGLKSLRICYVKESNEGDVLDIHLWQEEGDDLRVKAVIDRDGVTLCHVHLEYFGTVTSHL